jgi:membrane-associated phospholipid phosphatase
MSLGHGAPIFEPIRSSRLTYLSTQIFVVLLGCMVVWTLVQRLRPRGEVEQGAWRRIWRVTRDWLPAIMSLGIYESLKHLHLNEIILWLGNTPKDQLMMRIDVALFGGHASVWLQAIVSAPMTLYMELVYYVGYYVYPAVIGVFLYLFRPRAAFREIVLAFLATAFIGYTLYILVPVAGPRFELSHLYETTFVPKWYLQQMQEHNRFDYDCFPSLHTAIPLVVLVMAFRHCRWLGYVLLPFVLSTVLSTLYLQMHYLIDVVAGIALGPITVGIGLHGDRCWSRLVTWLGDTESEPAGADGAVASVRPRLATRVLQVLLLVVAITWVTSLMV